MARKRRHYLLTATAERDFRAAKHWSLSRWGKELTQKYFLDLHESAEDIARNPERYASVDYMVGSTELKIHPVREHYLAYLPISSKTIAIVALVRQTRDVPTILKMNNYRIQRQLKEIFAKRQLGKYQT